MILTKRQALVELSKALISANSPDIKNEFGDIDADYCVETATAILDAIDYRLGLKETCQRCNGGGWEERANQDPSIAICNDCYGVGSVLARRK